MKDLANSNLGSDDRSLLSELRTLIAASLPEVRLILFGSVARGESGRESDYDVYAITEAPVPVSAQREISEQLLPLELARSVVISLMFCSRSEWEAEQRLPLHREIQRDGILL